MYGDKVTVHLQHDEETNPDGELSREVNPAFKIPKDVDPSSIKAILTNMETFRSPPRRRAKHIRNDFVHINFIEFWGNKGFMV